MKKTIFIFFILLININFSSAKILVEDPNKIFKNLRCLICQGQSVADSNSDFAQTIKLVVKDKIAEGTSEEEIYEFLIEKYGEWIVYKPPFNGANLLLWTIPYIVFLVGGFLIFLMIKRRINR